MKLQKRQLRALVERELNEGFARIQDDSKEKLQKRQLRALVARNSKRALLFLKGAVR